MIKKKKKAILVSCRHFQMIFLGLPLENSVLLFARMKAKVKE